MHENHYPGYFYTFVLHVNIISGFLYKAEKMLFKKKNEILYPLKGLIYYEDFFCHSLSFLTRHTANANS